MTTKELREICKDACNFPRLIDYHRLKDTQLYYVSEVELHVDRDSTEPSWTVVFHYWKEGWVFVHNGFTSPTVVQRRLHSPITFKTRRYHAFIPESKLEHFASRRWKKEWPWEEKIGDMAAVFEFK
jgi:hypothetical protein